MKLIINIIQIFKLFFWLEIQLLFLIINPRALTLLSFVTQNNSLQSDRIVVQTNSFKRRHRKVAWCNPKPD